MVRSSGVRYAKRVRLRTGLVVVAVLTYACVGVATPGGARPSARSGGERASVRVHGDIVPAVAAALDSTGLDTTGVAIDSVQPYRPRMTVSGEATYYADKFEGRRTASGVRFRQNEMYAAHRTFPFGTVLRVINEVNGRSVIVRVVDRGPWGTIAERRNTIIDVSRRAAERLGFVRAGRTPVRLEVLLLGSGV